MDEKDVRIKSIKIDRFKRLEGVEFDVDGVNIIVGGNNSGKSTIIQAIHFAFTLFQSLTISNKWPVKTKKSSTISPSELIYVPSDDPYSLGFGGRLLEDESKSIILSFIFTNGESISVSVRKGRITNILVEPENVSYAQKLSSLNSPYTVFSPGLAGVSRNENYVSDGVLLRALARGDANVVLRNILYRLNKKPEWQNFENDLLEIFPTAKISIQFNDAVDQFINVNISDDNKIVPLDLAGTGFLQAVQILSYLHLFSPRLIILDEPDSHLHPNNQRLLCSLLGTISSERGVQVLVTTHSRHVLDTMYGNAKILWVQDGSVSPVSAEDQVDILLELGALDVKEKLTSGKFSSVILTEDSVIRFLRIVLRNSGFDLNTTAILPYNGVTSTHLLRPLVRQIKDISNAPIIVHRDRDYLEPDEIESWNKDIRAIGAEPFVTGEIDIEGYFCSKDYVKGIYGHVSIDTIDKIFDRICDGDEDNIISSYINGRIDHERKNGTIGKLDIGKLSAAAAKKINLDPVRYMKGKKKLSRLRDLFVDHLGVRYEIIDGAPRPADDFLKSFAGRHFKAKI